MTAAVVEINKDLPTNSLFMANFVVFLRVPESCNKTLNRARARACTPIENSLYSASVCDSTEQCLCRAHVYPPSASFKSRVQRDLTTRPDFTVFSPVPTPTGYFVRFSLQTFTSAVFVYPWAYYDGR